MNTTPGKQIMLSIVILFIIVNAICISFGNRLDKINIDHSVLLYANLLFFILGFISALIHIKTLKKNNPYAFVRSIMLGSFLKLVFIAAAVLIYLLNAGESRSIYAIAAAMMLYILYTIIEVKAAMRLNKNRNA